MKFKVHFVDDLSAILFNVKRSLETSALTCPLLGQVHFEVDTFESVDLFFEHLSNSPPAPHLALLDICMHDNESAGLLLTQKVRQQFPQTVIVMYSKLTDIEVVLQYVREGADEFISKEKSTENLAQELINVYHVGLQKRQSALALLPDVSGAPERFVGATMQQIAARAAQILKKPVRSIYVYGETGTGKEVVADIIQDLLPAHMPFVRINCGALSQSVLESQLFGHKKGAFTGADAQQVGLLESASGGWLFLDEVALLSETAQKALLRAIENQEVTRLGETKARKIDVKILSATNENLQQKVEAQLFRRDLWQRLCEVRFELLPLRKRSHEIPDFIKFFAATMEGGPYAVSHAAIEVLKKYNWKQGNIRELRNCLRAMTENSKFQNLIPANIPSFVFEDVSVLFPENLGPENKDSLNINLAVNTADKISLHELEENLFVQAVVEVIQKYKPKSLRALESRFDISRLTLTKKLRNALANGKLNKAKISDHILYALTGE